MTLFGSYYHLYFSAVGLLHPAGCGDAGHIHIRADVEQRTRETGMTIVLRVDVAAAQEVRLLRRI